MTIFIVIRSFRNEEISNIGGNSEIRSSLN